MKRLVICLFLLLLMVACGGDDNSKDDIWSPKPEGPVLLTVGTTIQFHVMIVEGRDLTAETTWSSSDTGILAFDSVTPGLAHGISAGEVVVTGTLPSSNQFTQNVKVRQGVLQGIVVSPTTSSIPVGGRQPFTAIATFDDNGEQFSQDISQDAAWSIDPPGIASLYRSSAIGIAIGIATGTATVQAVFDGQTAMATLTVTPSASVATAENH